MTGPVYTDGHTQGWMVVWWNGRGWSSFSPITGSLDAAEVMCRDEETAHPAFHPDRFRVAEVVVPPPYTGPKFAPGYDEYGLISEREP